MRRVCARCDRTESCAILPSARPQHHSARTSSTRRTRATSNSKSYRTCISVKQVDSNRARSLIDRCQSRINFRVRACTIVFVSSGHSNTHECSGNESVRRSRACTRRRARPRTLGSCARHDKCQCNTACTHICTEQVSLNWLGRARTRSSRQRRVR